MFAFIQTLNTEKKAACSHRADNTVIIEKIKVGAIETSVLHWSQIYSQVFAGFKNLRILAYSTFLKYWHAYFPRYVLDNKRSDECDLCFQLKLIIYGPNSTAEEIQEAELALTMHQNAARQQRELVKTLIFIQCI